MLADDCDSSQHEDESKGYMPRYIRAHELFDELQRKAV